jgi:hypothetical protein
MEKKMDAILAQLSKMLDIVMKVVGMSNVLQQGGTSGVGVTLLGQCGRV